MSFEIDPQRRGTGETAERYSRWMTKALVLTLLFGCDESIRAPTPPIDTDTAESSIVSSTEQPTGFSSPNRRTAPIDAVNDSDTEQTTGPSEDATDSDTSSTESANKVAADERISLINSRITSASSTVPSAQSVTLTLTLYDALGTVLSDAEADVVFTAHGGSSTGRFSEVVRTEDGTYTVEFTGIIAGTATTLGATINGAVLLSTPPTLTVEPGETDPAHAIITVAQSAIQPLGTTTIRLRTYDRHGNRRLQGGDTVSFRLIGGTSVGNFGSVIQLGDGSYECSFTGVNIGTAAQLGATINDIAMTSSATIQVTSGSGSAANSLVTVSSSSVASGSSVIITLRVIQADGETDYFGSHVVEFGLISGSSTGIFGGVTNNHNGTYTAQFTGVLSGTAATVGATLNGALVTTVLPTITVVPGPPSVSQSILELSQSAIAAGASTTVRLRTKDAAGNFLTSSFDNTVVFSRSGGTSTGTISTVTDNRDGTYSAIFTGHLSGSPTSLTATIDSVPVVTAAPTLYVYPGPISAAQSIVAVSASTVTIGSSVTVTLIAKDAAGNRLTTGGSAIVFAHSGGESTGSFGAVNYNGDGTYSAIFTGTSAGAATTIQATINGTQVTTSLPTIAVQ